MHPVVPKLSRTSAFMWVLLVSIQLGRTDPRADTPSAADVPQVQGTSSLPSRGLGAETAERSAVVGQPHHVDSERAEMHTPAVIPQPGHDLHDNDANGKAHSLSNNAFSACDLNQDGTVNSLDVQLIVNMSVTLIPCTADIDGPDVCNQYSVNQVVNSALGGACTVITGNAHTVTLSWVASTSPDISYYNIYRTNPTLTNPSGTGFTVLSSSTTTGFTDATVAAGFTYQYYTTAVDTSGIESVPSNTATAVVPFP